MDHQLEQEAEPIRKAAHEVFIFDDYQPLIDKAGEASVVLIGEASHGTYEFYQTRAELTRRLIEEKGFRAVVLEADWPDTYRVHRYATGISREKDTRTALSDFRRFPSWLWRNTVMLGFVEWLRKWNTSTEQQAGLYGMDLYSMHTSIESVLGYLDKVDPPAAQRARQRYACFEHFSEEPQTYGVATTMRGKEPCEDQVIEQLIELRRKAIELAGRDSEHTEEECFSAEQNARLVMNAERYYRAMYRGRDESWNLRDTHMFETLLELRAHLDGDKAKVVVWAHNSHLGDARATEMGRRGELNLGQLVSERFGSHAYSIGFSTYSGTVTAASDWGSITECKVVRPGMKGSYEALFHASGVGDFWLDLKEPNAATHLLSKPRLERAIGVIYRPETERWSHYFEACLPEQFDALIHIDETHAVEPLERSSDWDPSELPETYPSAV